jgi:hypothetical protein
METIYIVHKSTLVCQLTHNLFALKMFDLIYLFIFFFLFLSKFLKGIKEKGRFSHFFQDLLIILHCTPLLYIILLSSYTKFENIYFIKYSKFETSPKYKIINFDRFSWKSFSLNNSEISLRY